MALPALITFIVIFQSDIRTGLEKIGRQKFILRLIPDFNKLIKS